MGKQASQIDASSSGTIEYEGDYAYYIYEDGAVDLVKYNGSDENVVIPASFEGKTVVTISNEAFYAAENLKQVTIPEGVKQQMGQHPTSTVLLIRWPVPQPPLPILAAARPHLMVKQ